MAKKINNVIIICGDPCLFSDKIIQIKKHFFPKENIISNDKWIEINSPSSRKKSDSGEKFTYLVESELTCASWEDNEKKFIVLREIPDNDSFCEFLFSIFKNIPENNHLILCDKNNTINTGKSSFGKLDWRDIKQLFNQYATIVDVGVSLSSLSPHEKIKYVIDEFKKNDKKISQENASSFLEIIGDNRLAINGEIKKFCFAVDGNEISKEDVDELAFPLSKDYPIWQYYVALNTGSYEKIMGSATKLIENKFNADFILTLTLKQIRWQLIYAHMRWKCGNINDLTKFNSVKDGIRKKILKMNTVDPRILRQASSDSDKEFKNENIPSAGNSRDIISFLENILPKTIMCEKKNLKEVVFYKSIERYMSAFNGLFDLRINSTNQHEFILSDTLRRISSLR